MHICPDIYFYTKEKKTVCAQCASDEERVQETPVNAEDVIHDPAPKYCVRCRKKIASGESRAP